MKTEQFDRYNFLSEVGLISNDKPFLRKVVWQALAKLSDAQLQAAVIEAMSASAFQLKLADVISAHKRLTGQDEETLKAKALKAFVPVNADPNQYRDYIFEDRRAAYAFKLAFGQNAVAVLGSHPLPRNGYDPDEQLYVKTYLSITSIPDTEDGTLRGSLSGRTPKLVFVGDYETCKRLALEVYGADGARIPLLPGSKPALKLAAPEPVLTPEEMAKNRIQIKAALEKLSTNMGVKF